MEYTDIQVFLGPDVGKTNHWATAVDTTGEVLFSNPLPNAQKKIQAIYDRLSSHGNIPSLISRPPLGR